MTSERIKEIQQQTAYPDSISVQQALLQVWNECSTSSQTDENGKPLTYWGGVDFTNPNANNIKSGSTTSSQTTSDKWKEYQDWLNEHLEDKLVEIPTSSQTEISDEKIEKAARDYDNGDIYGPPFVNFEQGAFWYREQLKKL